MNKEFVAVICKGGSFDRAVKGRCKLKNITEGREDFSKNQMDTPNIKKI